jgi:CRP/FNR family transcriptional regulator, cyclic AMP receptor protein
LRLIEALAAQLEEREARLMTLAYQGVTARLAATLLRRSDAGSREIHGLTHQDLADWVGASRESVTRALDELHAAGIIELGRRQIRILNQDRLRALAEE